MSGKTIIAILCLQALALGCAAPRPVLYPNEQLKRAGTRVAQTDIDECMRRADEYVRSGGEAGKALESAGIDAGSGAVIGAAGGAAGGSILGRAGVGAAAVAAGGALPLYVTEEIGRWLPCLGRDESVSPRRLS